MAYFLLLLILTIRRQRRLNWSWYQSPYHQSCYCRITAGYIHPKLYTSLSNSYGDRKSPLTFLVPLLVPISPPYQYYSLPSDTDLSTLMPTTPLPSILCCHCQQHWNQGHCRNPSNSNIKYPHGDVTDGIVWVDIEPCQGPQERDDDGKHIIRRNTIFGLLWLITRSQLIRKGLHLMILWELLPWDLGCRWCCCRHRNLLLLLFLHLRHLLPSYTGRSGERG